MQVMRNEKTNFVNFETKINISQTTYSGFYRIGGYAGLSISLSEKPLWIHRKLMAICLGWEWIDNQ